jgi:NADH-quinone oxidoreductase subunit J
MDNLQPFLFWVLAPLTALCAIGVVVTQNIVRAATWLLFALAGASAIFFLLGADLVGATQLLVYVGGTLVLVVFGVMLTAQGPFISMKTGAAEWGMSAAVGLLLLGVLTITVVSVGKPGPPKGSFARDYAPKERLSKHADNAQYSAVIGEGFLGVGVGPAHKEFRPGQVVVEDPDTGEEYTKATKKAVPVRTNYLLPFEIISVHLLVVLIGAAYLARAKRRRRTAA